MGQVVSEKKIFYFFSHSQSMETINPRGMAKLDPRAMIGTIYNGDYQLLLHTKYCSFGPCGFREEDFFSFSNCKKVQVGKDQEKAQSEKDYHSKNRGGKKTKLTIRNLYHETYRKPNEQLFSQ